MVHPEYPFVGRPGCTDGPRICGARIIAIITLYLGGPPSRAGAGLALSELSIPDLDLIKQVEKVRDRRGRPVALPLGLRWRKDDEFAHPLSPGRGEGRHYDEWSE